MDEPWDLLRHRIMGPGNQRVHSNRRLLSG